MKIAERIVILTLVVGIFGGGIGFIFYVKNLISEEHQQKVADVALGKYQMPIAAEETEIDIDAWRIIYPATVTILIGGTAVEASVADSLLERISGLSGTPFLPDNVVKLFVFGVLGPQSIWMKDMNYPIDILWLDETGVIVHIEKNISPDTYPTSFSSPVPAWYVVEANAGFVDSQGITIGEIVTMPTL
ncbi:DUF192 domain-containing protein [Candidatus Parcubacteria bacterium]|nr:DUF192 domain-containing protein [Candidatus Parcubacteria bacterium]